MLEPHCVRDSRMIFVSPEDVICGWVCLQDLYLSFERRWSLVVLRCGYGRFYGKISGIFEDPVYGGHLLWFGPLRSWPLAPFFFGWLGGTGKTVTKGHVASSGHLTMTVRSFF